MFINLLSLIVGLISLGWCLKRFPEFLESIKTYDMIVMIGLGFYVVVSFISPMMVFTAVVMIGIIELTLRKKKEGNKMI